LTEYSPLGTWLPYIIIGVFGALILGVVLFLIFRPKDGFVQIPGSQRIITRRNKRVNHERLHEVYKLLTQLTSSLNYQRVLDSALDLSMRALSSPNDPSDRLVSAVLLFTEEDGNEPELLFGASRRLTRSDLRYRFPARQGLLKHTIDEGASLHIQDIPKDPELGRLIALQSCNSAYCIPLCEGLNTYGVLLFAHPETSYFTVERREVLDIISNQSVIAIQNARLYRDLKQEKERMVEIQEEARKKLARDLHDGPTQSVAAIAMRVNFARRLIERDPNASSEELYKIEDLARRTTKEIRHMLFTLRPLVLESQGLTAALESMADKMRETYEQNMILDMDPEIETRLEMGKQGVVFAIIEEAVSNARKYAHAPQISVRFKTIQNDIAVLEVEDNGIGFDVESVDANYEQRGSLGLVNMRERTELVNGIINIQSTEGQGSQIQVIIPLTEEATERLHRGST